MRADFNYLADLIGEFLSSKHINNRLKLIHDNEISGWEIWLQIEFAHFLTNHQLKPEWHREISLKFDRRSEFEKNHFRPDFLIRKKFWRSNSYTALEIKQHPSPASCISNMLHDINKVSKMRRSELNIRTLWAFGIFKADKECDLSELFNSRINSSANLSKYDFIGNTGFAYMLF